MRRDVNSVGEEKVAESKRSAKSVFGKYMEPVKKACMYAALPVFLTVAGCAAKNVDVKSSNDKAVQEKGLVAVEDVEKKSVAAKDEKNTVEELVESAEKIRKEAVEAVKEIVKEAKEKCGELDEKAAEEAYEKIREKCGDDNDCFLKEAESMNICESNDVKGDKSEDIGLLEKSAIDGLLYVLPNVPAEDLKGIKVVLNEKLANCGGEEKCEIPVKAGSLLVRVETDNENKAYIELKVAKVDEKGVYLDLAIKVFGVLSKSGPKYYRINFDGGKAAVFADGHEIALPEAFHHFDSVLAIADVEKAEAKSSGKKGEAKLILRMRDKAFDNAAENWMEDAENKCKSLTSGRISNLFEGQEEETKELVKYYYKLGIWGGTKYDYNYCGSQRTGDCWAEEFCVAKVLKEATNGCATMSSGVLPQNCEAEGKPRKDNCYDLCWDNQAETCNFVNFVECLEEKHGLKELKENKSKKK